MPTKNLRATRYITSELDGLQCDDLREKQARIQELLDAADLQQQAMEPRGEAAPGTTNTSLWPARTSRRDKLCCPTTAQRSTAGATELLAKAGETIAPSILATTTGSPKIRLRSPASCVTLLGQTQQSRRTASLRRKPSRPREPAKVLRVISPLART
jgi:hypothetical protein